MTGVAIGWFDPFLFHPNPPELGTAIRKGILQKTMGAKGRIDRSIRWAHADTGTSYVLLHGPAPLVTVEGPSREREQAFFFVIDAINRPAAIVAPKREETAAIFQGIAPPTVQQTFMLGGFELKPGMAFHLDETAQWLGFSAMPALDELATGLPTAMMIRTAGYGPEDIGAALSNAIQWVSADVGVSSKR